MKCISNLIFFVFLSFAVNAVNIVPYPSKVSKNSRKVIFDKDISVEYSQEFKSEGSYLCKILGDDFNINAKNGTGDVTVCLRMDRSLFDNFGEEGYTLRTENDKVVIKAASSNGVFYGIQTLRQIIEKSEQTGYFVSGINIEDKPRFGWRAFMLDESRNFKGSEVVKKLLDEMALLKLNKFHWHLTDDQGWRIEIKKYPLLTQIGAKRDSTQVGKWPKGWDSKVYDTTPHEGFYTKEQIKDILEYAKQRHITVIPEIEMPGHACAAIASYPWLGVSKEKIDVPAKFGVHYNIFDFTDRKVERFLKNVLKEVFEIFPSPVIHIGGDEVRHDHWEASEKVNYFMKKKDIASYADLQVWFTNRMSKFIESKGRRMMGWNDIMGVQLHEYNNKEQKVETSLAKNSIIHFWKGDVDLIKQAVYSGHDIVNSYHVYTYMDYEYNSIPMDKAYNFDPVPEGLEEEFHDKILGMGCQMWGEWIPTEKSMERLVFPRIAAYAEVGWTEKENKDYQRFINGLEYFYDRWTNKGFNYEK